MDPDDDDDIKYTIQGVTGTHRASLAVVIFARALMFCAVTFVGLVFLLKETGYLNLILNGLGLLFIVVLPADLYQQLLSPYMRSKVECVEPIEVIMGGFDALNRSPSLKDILWICVGFVVLFGSMEYYAWTTVRPVTEALQCACLSEGPNCREATTFSDSFWNNYWQFEVPRTIREIKAFEEKHLAKHGPAADRGNSRGLKHKGKHAVHLKTDVMISKKSFF